MRIPLSEFFRATQAEGSGNTGFIGLAGDGSAFHVVVPVDAQIARGVKAGNRPSDGTPFGGYTGWHYFECRSLQAGLSDPGEETRARWRQARDNAAVFAAWAQGLGFKITVDHLDGPAEP